EEPPSVADQPAEAPPLPIELELDMPLVGREHELAWLRGTWRQARRGCGRVVFVSGLAKTGKSRLAAELAGFAHSTGAAVSYAGAGGTAAALAQSALRDALADRQPTLVVLDDFDVTGEAVAPTLAELVGTVETTPTLVVGLVRDPDASRAVSRLIDRVDSRGDGHRRLAPLDAAGVREITRLYAGADVQEVPLESIARASGGVPGRVHEVMSDWAEREATRRLAAAAEFLATQRRERSADLEFANNVIGLKLARLYGGEERPVETGAGVCPYKGLASFEKEDARLFFGRERLVGELAARTVGAGLLAVVGASGSGKSSVIAAGLLPSLRAGLLPGSERWRSVVMRPGEHPLAALDSLSSSGQNGDQRFVLVIDQFEELFTTCQDEEERGRFVEQVVATARDAERGVVVLGLRADFSGECAAYPELAELLAANLVLVGPMTADELRRAVELPARRAGLRVESSLAEALVAEIGDEPGGLPLLSTALVELWMARSDGWLKLEAHETLGGVRGAVARLADSSYDNLTDEQRSAARRLFMRLVSTGEEGALARRTVPLSELDLERDPVLASVVERLTDDRLLTAHDSAVEVAHEALLREWPRFQEWLTEDAQGRELREHLTQSAKRWAGADRDAAELYRGARLSATLDWAAGRRQELNELEREFLAQSRAESERELARQRRT
ncbi:MAG TPA: ATP-binding protein, partial [Thermoleophilaceae bacterium]|nr:ATP-binding protein [Thermoleophilaceae bacterium]